MDQEWRDSLANVGCGHQECRGTLRVGFGLGTVEAGKLADLIVVRKNPLDYISHLGEILLVMKSGEGGSCFDGEGAAVSVPWL